MADRIPRVVRRKDEAQALLTSLSPNQREIVEHLARGKSVLGVSVNTTQLTLLDSPTSFRALPGGFNAVVNLEQTGWVKRAEVPAPGAYNWWLTTSAEKVLSLGGFHVRANAPNPARVATRWFDV